MDYANIFGRALEISWRHKYLWLLALFAGDATAAGTSFMSSGTANSQSSSFGSTSPTWAQTTDWISAHAALLWSAGTALAAVCIGLFILSAVVNGALVKAGAAHDEDHQFGLRQAWRAGMRTFTPILYLKLFAFVVCGSIVLIVGGLVLIAVVAAMTGAVAAAVAAGVMAGLLFLASIPFFIVFEVAILLAVRAVVLDGKGAGDGFRSALQLIWRRKGRVALFWLLVWVVGLLASTFVGLVLVLAAVPVVASTVGAYFAGGWALAFAVGFGLGTAFLIVSMLLAGGLNAFISTCWTLAYARFDLQPQTATTARLQPA